MVDGLTLLNYPAQCIAMISASGALHKGNPAGI